MKNKLNSLMLLCPLLLTSLTSCAPEAFKKLENHLNTSNWVTMKEESLNNGTSYKAKIIISDSTNYKVGIGADYDTNDNYHFYIDTLNDITIKDDVVYNEFKFCAGYNHTVYDNISMRSDWYVKTKDRKVKEARCLNVRIGSLNVEEQKDITKAFTRLINDTVNYFLLNDLPLFIG